MCYSAQAWQDYRKYKREFGATLGIAEFVRLFRQWASHRVADGDVLVLGDWRFHVLAVPGHTRSHVAYHGEGLLFCGDTLFSLGCGRMFEGTAPQMHASLMRLAALPGDTRVCCGHEYTQANAAFALAADPDNPQLQARAAEAAALRAAGKPTLP